MLGFVFLASFLTASAFGAGVTVRLAAESEGSEGGRVDPGCVRRMGQENG